MPATPSNSTMKPEVPARRAGRKIGPREEMLGSGSTFRGVCAADAVKRDAADRSGFLTAYIEPLRGLLKNLLSRYRFPTASLDRKVAVDFGQVGRVRTVLFQRVSRGLLEDHQLRLTLADGRQRRCPDSIPSADRAHAHWLET